MKPILLATRPKTLIASLSPICIGTCLAAAEGIFHMWVFLFTLLTGLGIQISTNVANDLFDFLKGADTANRKGPVRITANGLMSISQVKLFTMITIVLTALCGSALIFRGGTVIAFLVIFALLCALGYTTGPLPFAYLGLSEYFLLVFFGPVACGYTYYLQTLQLHIAPFLAGIAPGLFSCSIIVINNLRDIDEDQKAEKKTLVVRFGTQFGKWEFAISILLGCFISFLTYQKHPYTLLSIFSFLPALALVKEVFAVQDPYSYNPIFKKTAQIFFLYTLIFSCGLFIPILKNTLIKPMDLFGPNSIFDFANFFKFTAISRMDFFIKNFAHFYKSIF